MDSTNINDDYNAFIGGTTGMLKGLKIGRDEIAIKVVSKNCVKEKLAISNKNEISCLNWSDNQENEILIGMKNKIKTFDVNNENFSEYNLSGDVRGIFKNEETIFLGLSCGAIKSWKSPYEEETLIEEFNLNKNTEKMKRSIVKPNIVATGGKDNDLKLWDLNTKSAVLIAKNIKPDELQLQIPVWVSDLLLFPNNEKVATCTRHGYVRLYDPLLPQRRPIFNAHDPEQVFTCISDTPNDHQLIVGSASGNLTLVDLRSKCSFLGKYKGFCGAVKSISCPRNTSLVLSASLDRHFRVHDFTSRKLLVKNYMLSRLTTVLTKQTFELKKFEIKKEEEEEEELVQEFEISDKDSKSLDKIFDKLETVTEKKGNEQKPVKRKDAEEPASVKKIKWIKVKSNK